MPTLEHEALVELLREPRIDSCTHREELDRLIERAARAETIDDLF